MEIIAPNEERIAKSQKARKVLLAQAQHTLISHNLGGNLHDAANWLNTFGLADYVHAMETSGYNTVLVLKVPKPLESLVKDVLGL